MYSSQTITDRIKEQAQLQSLTISQLLKDCDLGKNTIGKMAAGTDVVTLNFAKIADVLNCSVDYLLGRTDKAKIERDFRPKHKLFAVRFKNICRKMDFSLKHLSDLTGIPVAELYCWTNGTAEPKDELLQNLANQLSVPIEYFTTDELDSEELIVAKNRLKDLLFNNSYLFDAVLDTYNVNYATLKTWLNGVSNFFDDKILELAQLLGVSVGFLLETSDGADKGTANTVISNSGIVGAVGTTSAPITINGGGTNLCTPQERDLLQIYNSVDGKRQIEIMNFMYSLEDKTKVK